MGNGYSFEGGLVVGIDFGFGLSFLLLVIKKKKTKKTKNIFLSLWSMGGFVVPFILCMSVEKVCGRLRTGKM